MANPEQITEQINNYYQWLKEKARLRKINESAIYNLVVSRCKDGERHTGIYWKRYLPKELNG